MGAARQKVDEASREALQRALDLARQAVAIVDEIDPALIAGVRGQHFIDELEELVRAS